MKNRKPSTTSVGWGWVIQPGFPCALAFIILIGCQSESPPSVTADLPANVPPLPTRDDRPVQIARSGESSPAGESKFSGIPIYITPYYNSFGPTVNVGSHSKALATCTADSIDDVLKQFKEEWETLPTEAMYVVSIRLYDLGRKDEAVYWFYLAQFRARLFRCILSKSPTPKLGNASFEIVQAHRSFNALAGDYINGYAFGDLQKLEDTLRRVKSVSEHSPRFSKIYPNVEFLPPESWPEKSLESAADIDKQIEFMTTHAEEIKKTRAENGVDGKY